ncbi:Oxidation resistance protein 1 [Ceratocystis platani]|uniref:Oxidation resistance protein 1 n=1 Tax=Ceratocystis fimbriata f. sp. platani TaxID=88771 RepID=A0A0F8BKK8_CERFI|nr:Oxidation resistance protein 1 [Ceratocystis platani]
MWELLRRFSQDSSHPDPRPSRNFSSIPRSDVDDQDPATSSSPSLYTSPPTTRAPNSRSANSGPKYPLGSHRHAQQRRIPSPFQPPPLDPVVLLGYKATTPTSARLLSTALAEEIRIMVPERLKLSEHWRIVYSLEQDGASLATLYQKARAYEGQRVGFVLVVRDSEGGTFGGYLSEYPRPSSSYFGNGECFLWRASILAPLPPPPSADTTNAVRSTTIPSPARRDFLSENSDSLVSDTSSNKGQGYHTAGSSLSPSRPHTPADPFESLRFIAFPYSGENDYCINCEAGFLSLGAGGGHYGLWIDNGLERGRSSLCDTFGNQPLSDEGDKFSILGLELWVVGA